MDDLLDVVLARIYIVGAVTVAGIAYVSFRCLVYRQSDLC